MSNKRKPVYVASPMLPDLDNLYSSLHEIWESGYVTNHGPFHSRLEDELQDSLKVPTIKLFNNGTIALLTALKLFNFPQGSEVITTPFTFAATAHAITWNGLKPVFADIKEDTLTIDPDAIEKAITRDTVAILAVHVYGTVCDLDSLERIAKKHGLKLIYDAAHAFGVSVNGRGIGNYGDATVFSFHATKLFNTIEGGAIATPNPEDADKIYYLRNFGIKNENEVISAGINGKMNEIQAAIGLLNLRCYPDEVSLRKVLREKYNKLFEGIPGVRVQREQLDVTSSQQYYPIIIDDEGLKGDVRDEIYEELKVRNIFTRKYFYPICTDFEPYKDFAIVSTRNFPVAENVKNKVLCLPFHSGVSDEIVSEIEDVCVKWLS